MKLFKAKPKFKELSHTADIKYKITASSLSEIFENTALAVSSYVAGKKKLSKEQKIPINLSADNIESLLYKFIDELLFFIDAKNFVVSDAKLVVENNAISGYLFGDSTLNKKLNHIKSATYAEMYIKNKGKIWDAQIVLDV